MRKYTVVCLLFICSALFAQKHEYLKNEITRVAFQPNCIDVNKDNTKLLIGGENKMVAVFDLEKMKMEQEFEAHYQAVMDVKFSDVYDGFYSLGDKSFKLWLWGAGEPEKLYKGSHTFITDMGMTAKEDFFVGGSYEKRFRCWNDTQPEEPMVIDTDQKKSVVSVAVSNNRLIAAGSLDSTIELWDGNSATRTGKILAHSGPVCCLQFIDGGKKLLSASHDGYAKLWDIETTEALKVYGGHTQPISNIDIRNDEKFLLTAAYDNTIGLYNIASGDCIYRYRFHKTHVLDVKWNASGTGFYSCDKDGNIVEWEVPKKVFVDFYFAKEIQKEMTDSKLFLPKQKGESKDDYKIREQKAEKFKQGLIDKYYQLTMTND